MQLGLFIIPVVVVGLDWRAPSLAPRGAPELEMDARIAPVGRHRRRRRFGRRGSTMQCQSRRGEPVEPTPRMGKYA